MEYLIGVGLALVVCAFAMLAGFDRDRVFYPTLLTVIATYYILFAVMGSSTPALAIESAVAGTFLVLAVAGFSGMWYATGPGEVLLGLLRFRDRAASSRREAKVVGGTKEDLQTALTGGYGYYLVEFDCPIGEGRKVFLRGEHSDASADVAS